MRWNLFRKDDDVDEDEMARRQEVYRLATEVEQWQQRLMARTQILQEELRRGPVT